MTNKEMLIPVIEGTMTGEPAHNARSQWEKMLGNFWLWFKGEKGNKTFTPDPAADLIAQIENEEVASIVRDLHYRTPKGLQAMRKTCEKCFILPDDCPYYDYTIFDVKKATRKLIAHPNRTHSRVVEELQKINHELAYHLNEYLEET